MSSRRTNQGGAIRSFIIIAIILAVLTVAGVYVVRNRGEQARRDQAIAAADKITADQKAAQTSTAASDGSSSAPAAQPTTPRQATDTNTVTTDATKSSELPTTGPTDSIIPMIALGLIVGSIVAYVSSRRALTQPL
jgi:Tfp pilus assembly major pilin PilA